MVKYFILSNEDHNHKRDLNLTMAPTTADTDPPPGAGVLAATL
jgi:hypothetical protein